MDASVSNGYFILTTTKKKKSYLETNI